MPPQHQMRRLTGEELARCIRMLEDGARQRHVAESMSVSQSVVSRAWNRYQTHGSASHRHGRGRVWSTTQQDDRSLLISARRHRFVTATTLQNDLRNATGANISMQTISNRLLEAGLRSWRTCIHIPLTQ